MKELDEIKEAEEFARIILAKKVRKALGEYYILWSTYPILVSFIYLILSSYVPSLVYLTNYISLGLVGVYVAYTSLLFSRTFSKRRILNPNIEKRVLRKGRLAVWAVFSAILSILIYLMFTSNNMTNLIFYSLMYSIFIVSITYNIAKYTMKIRYYDYIALGSFILSMSLGPINFAFYYIATLTWIYAGVKSIIDSYEGEKNE